MRKRQQTNAAQLERAQQPRSGGGNNGISVSLDDLTKRNIETIAQMEEAADHSKTTADRVADKITRFAGSMQFVYLHLAWFAAWILFNTLAIIPQHWRI